jgi:hypothetical protein
MVATSSNRSQEKVLYLGTIVACPRTNAECVSRAPILKASGAEIERNESWNEGESFMWKVKSILQRESLAKRLYLFGALLTLLLFAGVVSAQYDQHPLLDKVANKVIQKYQTSSCEQLWAERGQPKSQREQEAVNFLRSDPQMRAMFIDRVAAPVANKLFECGMIP